MNRFFCLLVSIGFVVSLHAQTVNWTSDGTGFFTIENNSIVLTSLPGFGKKLLIDSSLLIPAGQTRALAIRSFSFSDNGKLLLIYTNSKKVWRRDTRGDYWVFNTQTKTLKQLGTSFPRSSLMFAKLSPDDARAAYVSGHNLYVEDLETHKVKALTSDGDDRLINGTFDWAYEEEFSCRDGFRWSPDGKSIAFWQVDARKIRNFLMINNTDSLYSFVIPVEYPKAGQDPSPAKVGVVQVQTGKTVWMKVPGDPQQHYIPRMEWAANNSEIILEQLNRKQKEARIFICNGNNGAAKEIYKENDSAWIDVKGRWSDEQAGWEWLKNGNEFLWVSEKDGWRHIYRVAKDGKETLLTKGDYDMIHFKTFDANSGYVYFMASPQNATQQYLYRIHVSGNKPAELLSPASQKGTHNYSVSPNGLYASHSFSNIYGERANDWVNLNDQSVIKVQATQQIGRAATNNADNVEMFTITTVDNITMDGWMVKPAHFDSTKKYPVLFFVYAEPASATVRDAAGVARTRRYDGDIAADGYIQISVDGRGSPAPKGAAWRKAIYCNIGGVNIHDQAMAATEIMKWPFVDTSRIAVWGHSGGGSTTLNLLFQYPEIYKTGIALAPVANQLLYDNIYQERYMGLPQENMADYMNNSPISHAKDLRGNLLLIHGTGDDNVHYQGTEMLINELVKQGKQFELMVYPNRTHAISEGEGTTKHVSQLFTRFLKEHCPPGAR